MGERRSGAGWRPYTRWAIVFGLLIAAVFVADRFLATRPTALPLSQPDTLEHALDPELVASGQDVPGRDLKTVPRFLPSVRIFFAEEPPSGDVGRSFMVMYQCQGGLQTVSAYYEKQMPTYGWLMATKSSEVLHMDFVRQDAHRLGAPIVQMDFRALSPEETVVSILAIDEP